MAGHTKGPWFINPASGEEICAEGECYVLARVPSGKSGLYNRHAPANARLIAAAPDLLEALEKAAARFETVRARIYRLGANPGMKALELADYTVQCEAEIDAAIAKATGAA